MLAPALEVHRGGDREPHLALGRVDVLHVRQQRLHSGVRRGGRAGGAHVPGVDDARGAAKVGRARHGQRVLDRVDEAEANVGHLGLDGRVGRGCRLDRLGGDDRARVGRDLDREVGRGDLDDRAARLAAAQVAELHDLARLRDADADVGVERAHAVGHQVAHRRDDHVAVRDVEAHALAGRGDALQERRVQAVAEAVAERVHRQVDVGVGAHPRGERAGAAALVRRLVLRLAVGLEHHDVLALDGGGAVRARDHLDLLEALRDAAVDVRPAAGNDLADGLAREALVVHVHLRHREHVLRPVVEEGHADRLLRDEAFDEHAHGVLHQVAAAVGGRGLVAVARLVDRGRAHAAADVEDALGRQRQRVVAPRVRRAEHEVVEVGPGHARDLEHGGRDDGHGHGRGGRAAPAREEADGRGGGHGRHAAARRRAGEEADGRGGGRGRRAATARVGHARRERRVDHVLQRAVGHEHRDGQVLARLRARAVLREPLHDVGAVVGLAVRRVRHRVAHDVRADRAPEDVRHRDRGDAGGAADRRAADGGGARVRHLFASGLCVLCRNAKT